MTTEIVFIDDTDGSALHKLAYPDDMTRVFRPIVGDIVSLRNSQYRVVGISYPIPLYASSIIEMAVRLRSTILDN
jgi:hypothetical protein